MMNQLDEGLRYKSRLWREAGREPLEAFRLPHGPAEPGAIFVGVAKPTHCDDADLTLVFDQWPSAVDG
jgi:hypothetical protein